MSLELTEDLIARQPSESQAIIRFSLAEIQLLGHFQKLAIDPQTEHIRGNAEAMLRQ